MRKLIALAGAGLVAVGVLAGSAPAISISGAVTSSDPTLTTRLNRFLPTSTCGTAKAFPGTFVTGNFHYDAIGPFTNVTGTPQCVTVTLTTPGANDLFAAAYCPSFDPANLATNYAADAGVSSTSETFSFTMAAGATCVVVVNEVEPGFCGEAGCPYTLDVTGSGIAVAARFRSLSAVATGNGALVRWRTASEVDALGFNVYRAVQGRRVRVNPRLIPARGARAYSFLDRKAPHAKSLRYWIQLVNFDGSRSWYGPARVAR
jgi:hypothetical protein